MAAASSHSRHALDFSFPFLIHSPYTPSIHVPVLMNTEQSPGGLTDNLAISSALRPTTTPPPRITAGRGPTRSTRCLWYWTLIIGAVQHPEAQYVTLPEILT